MDLKKSWMIERRKGTRKLEDVKGRKETKWKKVEKESKDKEGKGRKERKECKERGRIDEWRLI